MKSVGETMAIGRTFKEALQKGLRSLEVGAPGLGSAIPTPLCPTATTSPPACAPPTPSVCSPCARPCCAGFSLEEDIRPARPSTPGSCARSIRHRGHGIRHPRLCPRQLHDPRQPRRLVTLLRKAKGYGFSDRQLAEMLEAARRRRGRPAPGHGHRAQPIILVDTCAGRIPGLHPLLLFHL